jgi:hypothetical protein
MIHHMYLHLPIYRSHLRVFFLLQTILHNTIRLAIVIFHVLILHHLSKHLDRYHHFCTNMFHYFSNYFRTIL